MPVCIPYSGFPLCAAVGVEVDDLGRGFAGYDLAQPLIPLGKRHPFLAVVAVAIVDGGDAALHVIQNLAHHQPRRSRATRPCAGDRESGNRRPRPS